MSSFVGLARRFWKLYGVNHLRQTPSEVQQLYQLQALPWTTEGSMSVERRGRNPPFSITDHADSEPPTTELSDEQFLALFDYVADTVRLEPGQRLFKKGEKGTHMYVVRSGELAVGEGNYVFDTLRAGAVVGEMALIDEAPRSATVRALTKAELIPVSQARFLFLVQQTPFFAIRILRVLSGRLRAMDKQATDLPD
jgi:CRP/FNR family transcriptional regulator, cyclic AMP receptor protein